MAVKKKGKMHKHGDFGWHASSIMHSKKKAKPKAKPKAKGKAKKKVAKKKPGKKKSK
jgi:hypothetical protein